MGTKTNDTLAGTFSACGHRIVFWYDTNGVALTPEMERELTEAAEERARELLAEDFVGGELCHYITEALSTEDDLEFRGWWGIDR